MKIWASTFVVDFWRDFKTLCEDVQTYKLFGNVVFISISAWKKKNKPP